ncbi:hypothetical protein ABPG74_016993 [Tetrahymena malaccensis]
MINQVSNHKSTNSQIAKNFGEEFQTTILSHVMVSFIWENIKSLEVQITSPINQFNQDYPQITIKICLDDKRKTTKIELYLNFKHRKVNNVLLENIIYRSIK